MGRYYGIGVNDLYGSCTGNPAYVPWKSMMQRSYCPKYKALHPTYVSVTCDPEWNTFSVFSRWFNERFKDGYQLDKDILIRGNRVYSPSTCVLVPRWINMFVTEGQANKKTSPYPIGVYLNDPSFTRDEPFLAQIKDPFAKKRVSLGSFVTAEEGHEAWKKRKIEYVETMRNQLDEIDLRLYPALLNRYKDF